MLDVDNDGDLDLALIDELEDEVIVMRNSGVGEVPAVSAWGLLALVLFVSTAGTLLLRLKPRPRLRIQ